MKLWTIQLGQWRLADKRKIPLINTTVMSGCRWLAPTWDMVKSHKLGIYSDEDYIFRFVPMMVLSQHVNRQEWLALIAQDEVAIACYCSAGAFCHRRLLIEILKEFCEQEGVEFTYLGELTKEAA